MQLLKELGTCLHICLSIFFVARLILGLLITVFTEFEKEVLILSIFSLLNLITLFIAFIFFTKAMFNGKLTLINQEGIYIPLQLILQKKILKLEGKDGEKKISFLKMG